MPTRLLLPFIVLFLIPASLTLTGAAQLEPGPPAWTVDASELPCEMIAEPVSGAIGGGEEVIHTFDLEPGTYSVGLWSSWDVVSIQMSIKNPLGQVMTRDEGLDGMPICDFDLDSAETVSVVLVAGAARVQDIPADYFLALTAGDDCFERRDTPAVRALLDDWTGIISEVGGEIEYWDAVTLSGEEKLFFNYQLSPGFYSVVAETTDTRDDIDMYVRRGTDIILSMDELPNNNPVCFFELGANAEVTIEIDPWNYGRGDSTGLVLLVAEEPEPD